MGSSTTTSARTSGTRYNDPAFQSADLFHSSRQGGAYVQDEIRVRPWLLLNGGVRYDQYENFGRATPRGAVIVSPRSGTSFKYLYGEAFRAPNAYELYYYGTTPSDLQPEFVRTHEVVWEQYRGRMAAHVRLGIPLCGVTADHVPVRSTPTRSRASSASSTTA